MALWIRIEKRKGITMDNAKEEREEEKGQIPPPPSNTWGVTRRVIRRKRRRQESHVSQGRRGGRGESDRI